jgi:hypothetical protein
MASMESWSWQCRILRKCGGADLVAADKLAALFGLCFFRCYIDAGEASLLGRGDEKLE